MGRWNSGKAEPPKRMLLAASASPALLRTGMLGEAPPERGRESSTYRQEPDLSDFKIAFRPGSESQVASMADWPPMPIWAPSRPVAQRSPDMYPEYDNGSLLDDAILSTPRTPIGPNGICTHPTDHAGLVERGPLGGLHGGLLTHLPCRGYYPIPTAVRTKEQNLQMALAIDPPGQRSRQSHKLLWAADCTGWEELMTAPPGGLGPGWG